MKKLLCMLLLCVVLAGCSVRETGTVPTTTDKDASSTILDDPFVGGYEYEAQNFFVEAEEFAMCTDYSLCYRHPDGTVERIADFGTDSEASWRLVGQRLFYASGMNLNYIDLSDGKIQHFDRSEGELQIAEFKQIIGEEDGWLCCWVRKNADAGGSTAAPTSDFVDTRIWVKTDFSEYYEDEAFKEN